MLHEVQGYCIVDLMAGSGDTPIVMASLYRHTNTLPSVGGPSQLNGSTTYNPHFLTVLHTATSLSWDGIHLDTETTLYNQSSWLKRPHHKSLYEGPTFDYSTYGLDFDIEGNRTLNPRLAHQHSKDYFMANWQQVDPTYVQ